MDNVLVRIEFGDMVVKVTNPQTAQAIKEFLLGKLPEKKIGKGGYKKHRWTDTMDELLRDTFKSFVGGNAEKSREAARLIGEVTPHACYARA